jgi:long-chain acyl-CoA synthetase
MKDSDVEQGAKYRVPGDRSWFKVWPENVPVTLDYPDIPLFEFLSQAALRWPDRTAFSCRDRHLTYGQLDELSNRLASCLASFRVGIGDRVILFLPNSLEFVLGYYGILKSGATVTTTNPLYRQNELRHQFRDTGSKVVITDKERYPLVAANTGGSSVEHIIVVDGAAEGALSLQKVFSDYSPEPPVFSGDPRSDVAVIVYTGGTTGLPKGVMLTHRNLVANSMQNVKWFGWTENDVVIGLLPFYHSWGGSTCVNSPVHCGSKVLIIPRFDPKELLETIEREKATVLYGAASLFASLALNPLIEKYDISSLKYVKAGAMPIAPEIKERWERIAGVEMVLGYGLSEASPETHSSPPGKIKTGTIGIPVIDTDARIVDKTDGVTDMPPGEIGELVIRGPQVMKGYLNAPEETAEILRDGWLYTGDLAVIDDEGYFSIVDRKKETILYKGYTIAPAEVEAALYEHPAVKECAVVGKPDPSAGEIPKAYVVLKPGSQVSKEELVSFCAERIAPYKRIREVEFIDEIPKTPVGKVLRRILRDREIESA